jgi:GMP synthase (glutamine-hydrolysing)
MRPSGWPAMGRSGAAALRGAAGRAAGLGEPWRRRGGSAARVRGVGHERDGADRGHGGADRGLYGLLFHPEVVHTDHGHAILRAFAFDVCGCTGDWTIASFIEEATARIRQQVGEGRVVCGLSGGVDSTVAAMLIHRAIGDRLTCIFVDNGLLRYEEAAQIRKRFTEKLQLPLDCVDATDLFLDRLAGVTDPEQKRKIIGATFIDVFERRAAELGEFGFLGQGTLYPDVIESASATGRPWSSRAITTSAACPSG